jgi:hypothetical protein
MITASYPPVEFEHDVPKLERVGNSCVALTAGDALAHVDLFRTARQTLAGLDAPTIQQIVEVLRISYGTERLKVVEQRILGLRGWKLADFYTELPKTVPPDIFMLVDHSIATYDYGVELLVAGVDTEGHIHSVRNPGHTDCFDALGYNAIGSGSLHALSTFIANSCCASMSINQGAYFVYEAKRAAEVAPGVGKHMDMAIVKEDGVHVLTDTEINVLDEVYNERIAPRSDSAAEAIAKLPFEGGESKL